MKQRSSLRIKATCTYRVLPSWLVKPNPITLQYDLPRMAVPQLHPVLQQGLSCTQDLTIQQKESLALPFPSTTVSSPVCTRALSLWMVNSDLPK